MKKTLLCTIASLGFVLYGTYSSPAMAEESAPSMDDIIASADSNAIRQLRDKSPNELMDEIMTRIAVLNEQNTEAANQLQDEVEQPAAGNAANDEQQGNLSISSRDYYNKALALGKAHKIAAETLQKSFIELKKSLVEINRNFSLYEKLKSDAQKIGPFGKTIEKGWTDGHQ